MVFLLDTNVVSKTVLDWIESPIASDPFLAAQTTGELVSSRCTDHGGGHSA